MRNLAAENDAIMVIQDRLLSCSGLDFLATEVLAPTSEFLNAATSCFLQVAADSSGNVRFGRTAAHNVPEGAHRSYLEHHFRDDPAITAVARNSGRAPYVFCTAEVSDYRQLVNTEFYNNFFRPNQIHHVMVMALRPLGRAGDILMLGFHRPQSERPFNDPERRRLHRLSSTLGCTVRMLCLQDDVLLRDRAMEEFEEVIPEHGLAFFDDNMTLLYANRTGVRHLQLGHSGLQACMDLLTRACRQTALIGHGRAAVSVDLSESEDLVAKICARRDGMGRLLYSVHTNRRREEVSFTTKCREFDFSHREIDIVRALAAGLSNAEIAERLFISIRTVENHLRSIYSKAGVNRRTQLLSRLSDYS